MTSKRGARTAALGAGVAAASVSVGAASQLASSASVPRATLEVGIATQADANYRSVWLQLPPIEWRLDPLQADRFRLTVNSRSTGVVAEPVHLDDDPGTEPIGWVVWVQQLRSEDRLELLSGSHHRHERRPAPQIPVEVVPPAPVVPGPPLGWQEWMAINRAFPEVVPVDSAVPSNRSDGASTAPGSDSAAGVQGVLFFLATSAVAGVLGNRADALAIRAIRCLRQNGSEAGPEVRDHVSSALVRALEIAVEGSSGEVKVDGEIAIRLKLTPTGELGQPLSPGREPSTPPEIEVLYLTDIALADVRVMVMPKAASPDAR